MAINYTTEAGENSIKTSLIDGSLSRYTGTELFISIGSKKTLTRRQVTLLARKVVALARQNQIKNLSLSWKEIRKITDKKVDDADLAELLSTAFEMANYEHTTYKTAPREYTGVESIALDVTPAIFKSIERGVIIGETVNQCRELANTPGGDMTPEILAEAAVKAAQETSVKVKVLGRAEMERMGMGAVLGVAKGSAEEPQFIVMEYWGTDRNKKPIVLVGKGVTFDTGGIQVKPGDHMYEMHMDMSGGAAVIFATILAAKLGVKKNVVALVPAVENNLTNGMRPGDILKSLSGKTIEILHTDAEGRVILADALTYAKKYNPQTVVDVATLTGASLIALGEVASAFMTNKDSSVPDIMDVAEVSGDYMWPLPLWEEYDEMVKGKFGDVPNISTMGNSRYGGVIAGGKFLEVFAKELECPWIHIDMAPRMTSYTGEYLAKGAAGAPVRFLLKLIEQNKVK